MDDLDSPIHSSVVLKPFVGIGIGGNTPAFCASEITNLSVFVGFGFASRSGMEMLFSPSFRHAHVLNSPNKPDTLIT